MTPDELLEQMLNAWRADIDSVPFPAITVAGAER